MITVRQITLQSFRNPQKNDSKTIFYCYFFIVSALYIKK